MKRILASFSVLALLIALCGTAQAASYFSDTNNVNSPYTFDRIDWSHSYDGSVDTPHTAKLTITAFDVDNGEKDEVYLKTGSGDVYLGDLTQLGTWDSYYPEDYNYYTTTEFDVTSYLSPIMEFYVLIYDGLNSHAMKLETSLLEVAATPIPGAAWLLGSGLIGLLGLRRRMRG